MDCDKIMRLKLIACDVLNREISYLSSRSRCVIDTAFLHQGLHNTPELLRKSLQDEIDKANEGYPYNYHGTAPDYDFIILAYGLCSNGITGLKSSRIPLIVPRAHDCITLLLGSKERYSENFQNNPGTYWFSAGWIERSWQPGEKKYRVLYDEYLEKYGEDNAQYLLETEQGWMKNYKNAAFIAWDCLSGIGSYREFTQKSAQFLGWNYNEFVGDNKLLEKLLNAEFDDDLFLTIPPEAKIEQSFDENIVSYTKDESEEL